MPTSTPRGDVLEQARQVIEDSVHGLAKGNRVGTGLVREVIDHSGTIAEAVGGVAVVEGGPEAGALGAIIAGIGDLLAIIGLLQIVLLIRVIRWFEYVLVSVFGSIWVVGPGVGHLLKNLFSVVDPLENAVAIACADLGVGMIQSTIDIFTGLMAWAGYQVFPPGASHPTPKNELAQIQQQLTHMERDINYLKSHAGVTTYTITDPHSTSGVPANLWDQLHGLQADMVNLKKSLQLTQGRVDVNARQITSVEHQIDQLTHSVHAVRAVSTGWQDVENMVAQLQNTMTTFVNVTTADIATQHRAIAHLQPLSLLLTAGSPGLKILRQLEDTPCMCPRIPTLPSLTPEWLAMYEFITHG